MLRPNQIVVVTLILFIGASSAYAQCPPPVFNVDVQVSPSPNAQRNPCLTVNPYFRPLGIATVYVVWTETFPIPMLDDVRFSRSTDGGATWSMAVTINTTTLGHQRSPAIAVNQDTTSKGVLWAVWEDHSASPLFTLIKLSVSSDQGDTWSPSDIFVDTTSPVGTFQNGPRVTAKQEAGWILWADTRNAPLATAIADVFMACATIFPPMPPTPPTVIVHSVFRLNDAPGTRALQAPDIDESLNTIHAAWQDRGLVLDNILYSSIITQCSPPTPEMGIPLSGTSLRQAPAIESNGMDIWVTYDDTNWFGSVNSPIVVQSSTDAGMTWGAPVKIDPTFTFPSFSQNASDITMTLSPDEDSGGPTLPDDPNVTPRLYAGWYERRIGGPGSNYDFMVSCSTNGGADWSISPTQINDVNLSLTTIGPLRISLFAELFNPDPDVLHPYVWAAWADSRPPGSTSITQIWVDIGH